MNVLFLHPTFPGQFLQLARYLGAQENHNVVYLSREQNGTRLYGVNVNIYLRPPQSTKNVRDFAKIADDAVLEGTAVARAIHELMRKTGFVPDVVIGHTGWGSTLYVKDLLPRTPLIGYFEWYYNAYGGECVDDLCRIRTANAPILMNLQACDIRYTPTEWQKAQFPTTYQQGMRVIPEGVETAFFKPRNRRGFVLPRANLDLSDCNEVVTYLSRGFEPYRGFPAFMESVRVLLGRRPHCHVVIAGNDKACYGAPYAKDKTWKQAEEEKGGYDKSRVHFIGHVSRDEYLTMLQASDVHVYLTKPHTILSWSCLESMGAGCCIVASNTPPVQEVVESGVNGLLADLNCPEEIAACVEEVLINKALRMQLKKNARQTILDRFNLDDCLREQLKMINEGIEK